MRKTATLIVFAAASFLFYGCGKTTSATADSARVANSAGSFDENAARAQILAADSAFVRAMLAKNVDSLMPYYDANAVSLGKSVVKGTDAVRAAYTQAVKTPPSDVSFQSGGVNFSNDHSMAWDYGTVSQTAHPPNGKVVKESGTFLNVWKNVGGRWVIVAEISSVSP